MVARNRGDQPLQKGVSAVAKDDRTIKGSISNDLHRSPEEAGSEDVAVMATPRLVSIEIVYGQVRTGHGQDVDAVQLVAIEVGVLILGRDRNVYMCAVNTSGHLGETGNLHEVLSKS
jgi:hypothetical protein